MESFSARIQKIMDHYDLSASAFADQIDTGRSSISHILSGRNKPSLDLILKITETFADVDINWLAKGGGDFPKNSSEKKVFSPEVKTNSPKKNTSVETPDLFSDITSANIENSESPEQKSTSPCFATKTSKKIQRIVLFYDDGTFESYQNEVVQ